MACTDLQAKFKRPPKRGKEPAQMRKNAGAAAGAHEREDPPKDCAFGGSDLLRVFDNLRLAQDMHLDLTGILQLVLDALGELARQNDHLILGHLLGLDHHADLTAGLNGVALLDAGIGARDLLELLQTLDVVLEVLTALLE